MAISKIMSMSLISASSSMKMVRTQQGVRKQMEGKAGVLKAEIKQDGGAAKAPEKQEELERVEAKAKDVESSQMSALSDMNSSLKQAAKDDQQEARAEKAAEKKKAEKAAAKKKAEAKEKEEKAEKAAQDEKTADGHTEQAASVDIVSEGVTTNVDMSETVGGKVDVKA